MDICQKHLHRYGNKWDIFLDRIITGDETWVHHYELKSKRQSMEWKHPHARKSSKPNHPQKNWSLQCFGNHKAQTETLSGEVHNNKHYTVQWDTYCQAEVCILKQKLRTTVERCFVARQCPSTYCCPHCWNSPELKFEIMAPPPYSPDLAPSNYHLFGPLKESLRGHWFTSDQEVKEVVYAWLAAQPKTLFSEGIRKLL